MTVNYIAIIVASIVVMIIGFLWYSPLLFGNVWMKLSNISKKDIDKNKKKGMGKYMLAAFVALLLTAGVMEFMLELIGYTDFFSGVVFGFLVWLGFVATVMLNNVLWEGKSVPLYLLNILYELVVFVVMGGILGVW